MRLWFYAWEDGTFSICEGKDRTAATLVLDEIGGADRDRLVPIRISYSEFLLTFGRNLSLIKEDCGERTRDFLDDSGMHALSLFEDDDEDELSELCACDDTLCEGG